MQSCICRDIDHLHERVYIDSLCIAAQQGQKLLFTFLAMRDILGQLFLWVGYDLTMRRNDFGDIKALHASERIHVVYQITFGRRWDHDSGATREQVACEEGALLFQQEAEVVKTVTRCVDGTQRVVSYWKSGAICDLFIRKRNSLSAKRKNGNIKLST